MTEVAAKDLRTPRWMSVLPTIGFGWIFALGLFFPLYRKLHWTKLQRQHRAAFLKLLCDPSTTWAVSPSTRLLGCRLVSR